MDQGLGILFDAVKLAVRSGAVPKADPAIMETIRTFLGPIRDLQKKHRISLDALKENRYCLIQSGQEKAGVMKKFIAYLQKPTKAQGASGLELQRTTIEAFAGQNGGQIVREFVEVVSSKKVDRPELVAALDFAKQTGAILLVAELNRLARNGHFLAGLLDSGVEFRATDNPFASSLIVHVLAAVVEHDREATSSRTKAALGRAKSRGVLLGSARPDHWTGREDSRLKGGALGRKVASKSISAAAREAYRDLEPMIQAWRAAGLSFQKIADRLNADGHQTRRGAKFTPSHVLNILKRMDT